jgi:hypothetical protein
LTSAVLIHEVIDPSLVGRLKYFSHTVFIKGRKQCFLFFSKNSTSISDIEISGVLDYQQTTGLLLHELIQRMSKEGIYVIRQSKLPDV